MNPAFLAIAEPRRAEIVRLVWHSERIAGDIAERLPISFGAVSQHLGVLLKSGALRVRVDGRRRWYIADHIAFGPMASALEEMWFGKLGRLKELAEAEQAEHDRASPKRQRRTRAAASARSKSANAPKPSRGRTTATPTGKSPTSRRSKR